MKSIFTPIFTIAITITSFAQNPLSSVLSTNFDAAFGGSVSPTGWVSANILTPDIVSPDFSGYGGSFSAAKIVTKTFTSPDPKVIPNTSGILLSGSLVIFPPAIKQGHPYTSKPEGMAYYTKYAPVGNDTAFAIIALTKWNNTSKKREYIGFANDTISNAITNWTKRDLKIIYNNTTDTPDTLTIIFSSSSRTAAQVGSTYTIDEISLYPIGTSALNEGTINTELQVYPNPAKGQINIANKNLTISNIEIIDITGRVLKTEKITSILNTINTADLHNGVYFIVGYNADNKKLYQSKFEILN